MRRQILESLFEKRQGSLGFVCFFSSRRFSLFQPRRRGGKKEETKKKKLISIGDGRRNDHRNGRCGCCGGRHIDPRSGHGRRNGRGDDHRNDHGRHDGCFHFAHCVRTCKSYHVCNDSPSSRSIHHGLVLQTRNNHRLRSQHGTCAEKSPRLSRT